jgi:hypothetical protein
MFLKKLAARPRGRSKSRADSLARGLGWFSIGLGAAELLAPRPLARALGMERAAPVLRGYGLRELATGFGILSAQRPSPWIWGRVAGDAIDLLTLLVGERRTNPRKGHVDFALAMVGAVTAVDIACAAALGAESAAHPAKARDYSDRSGFPGGLSAARGAARNRSPAQRRSVVSDVGPGAAIRTDAR